MTGKGLSSGVMPWVCNAWGHTEFRHATPNCFLLLLFYFLFCFNLDVRG